MDKLNFFVKSHGLGNEYIVLDQQTITFDAIAATPQLCDIHFGIGSDGVLLKVPSSKADFGLRIFNPDGSEAEKSGNGLRIFCKYLFDYGFTRGRKEFSVETLGGLVQAHITQTTRNKASEIRVDIGKATFTSAEIPTKHPEKESLGIMLPVADQQFKVNCVSVGNPHCVIITNELNEETVRKYGPQIEHHALFPNRINVQFAKVISPNEIEILIWERGAGYTLASGTSSSAVACVCHRLGLTSNDVTIRMQGGTLKIGINSNWEVTLCGAVSETASGYISDEFIESLNS